MSTEYVQTSQLKMAYEVKGATERMTLIMLHGFPDDIRSWDRVVESMDSLEQRVYLPYLRGYGLTQFLSADTVRSGQTGRLALDIIEFADALGLEKFGLVGHDWGANIGQALAALYPERVNFLISLAPYSLSWQDYQQGAPNYAQMRALWYQNFLNQEWAEGILTADRNAFCRYLWETWSPDWQFSETIFEKTAQSFANPDFVEVVLHAYRGVYGQDEDDPHSARIEEQLAQRPAIKVPTTVLLGQNDGVSIFQPWMLHQEHDFCGMYEAQVFEGVGHFLHRERPTVIIEAIRNSLRKLDKVLPAQESYQREGDNKR